MARGMLFTNNNVHGSDTSLSPQATTSDYHESHLPTMNLSCPLPNIYIFKAHLHKNARKLHKITAMPHLSEVVLRKELFKDFSSHTPLKIKKLHKPQED